jgi:hypothetical protein
MKYYDKVTGDVLGQREGVLNAGEFYEDSNQYVGRGLVEGFRGTSVWEADKPIFVMQYSYSANWDKGDIFDPFMIIVTPQEQYIQATVFQSPANSSFSTNWFNVIAEGDPNDPEQKKLKSVALDGKQNQGVVISNIITAVSNYMDPINRGMGQNVNISEIRRLIQSENGVIAVTDILVFNNIGGQYSSFETSQTYLDPATKQIEFIDETIFAEPQQVYQVRFPNKDIQIRVKNLSTVNFS